MYAETGRRNFGAHPKEYRVPVPGAFLYGDPKDTQSQGDQLLALASHYEGDASAMLASPVRWRIELNLVSNQHEIIFFPKASEKSPRGAAPTPQKAYYA